MVINKNKNTSFSKYSAHTAHSIIVTRIKYSLVITPIAQVTNHGNSPAVIPPKATHKLNPIQRQVLVGLLLGDGHLRGDNRKGKRALAYSLTCLQSDKHKEYVLHLYEIFKEFVVQPPRYYEFTDPRNPGKIYKRWSFSTTMQGCFRFYGQQFYSDHNAITPLKCHSNDLTQRRRVKRVTTLISRLLTPRSLAYWYMDDGAAKWQGKSLGVRYCTDNFTKKEVDLLVECLQNKFSLQCTIQKKDGRPRIYVKHNSYPTLKGLIEKHIIPSMKHKLPREY